MIYCYNVTNMQRKQSSVKDWRRVAMGVLILAPAAGLIALLAMYAVNVPFWDQWEFVTIAEKWQHGTLGFADFFAQHNEHRILFPRLIMFVLAVMTHWNTVYEVATNVLLAGAAFWFLWLLIKPTFTNVWLRSAVAAVVSLLFFSPSQFENWLWGWQIQWFLNVLGLVVAVWALSAWKAKPIAKFVLAAVTASVATYSLASGFFVWLVCLPILWLNKDLRKLMWWWISAAVVVVGSHYIGYVDPAYHPSKTLFLHEPINFIKYVLVYIGRPLIVDFSLWAPTTILYLAGFLVALGFMVKKHAAYLTGNLLPWLCIGLYGLFAAGSTGVSRLGFGVEQAYSSRYITLSNLLLIAGLVVLFKIVEVAWQKKAIVRNLALVAIVGATLLIGVNYAKGAIQTKERHAHLIKVQQCAHNATSADDECLLLLYPNKQVVWERLQYLRSIHWGGL